jgi:hypothetical protein
MQKERKRRIHTTNILPLRKCAIAQKQIAEIKFWGARPWRQGTAPDFGPPAAGLKGATREDVFAVMPATPQNTIK